MARKPLEQLSPAYRRRIENAMAKGKSRQAARGHKAKEHVYRKEREREQEGLTKAEQRIVFMWAFKRSFEIHDSEVDAEDVLEWAKGVGYDAFKTYRNTWDAVRRQYKRDLAHGTWASKGIGFLELLVAQTDAPDISWLYYH